MPRLLISTRNVEEAIEAIEGGAEILDIKEPNAGALGRADQSVWTEIINANQGKCPITVACGELTDPVLADSSVNLFESIQGASSNERSSEASPVQFAKVGLSQLALQPNWIERWFQWSNALPAGIEPVAVWYADQAVCSGPSLSQVMKLFEAPTLAFEHNSQRRRPAVLLVDTYSKTGKSLFDFLSIHKSQQLINKLRQMGISSALAGSLHGERFEQACHLQPDIVAVRGAACSNGRNGKVDRTLVEQLAMTAKQNVRKRGSQRHPSSIS